MAGERQAHGRKDRRRDQRQRAQEIGARRIARAPGGDGQLRERRAQDTEPGGKTDGDGEREVGRERPRRKSLK
jgi:hypothetical protein